MIAYTTPVSPLDSMLHLLIGIQFGTKNIHFGACTHFGGVVNISPLCSDHWSVAAFVLCTTLHQTHTHMAHHIIEDGILQELDVKLVTVSTQALIKVNNPPSSRVAQTRPRPNVLSLIRKRGEERRVVIKAGNARREHGTSN